MQNLVSIHISPADLTAIDGALDLLEQKLGAVLCDLRVDQRQALSKMGDKSESFCRQTIVVLGQNTGALPANFNLAEAQGDLNSLDTLRPRFTRIAQLSEKCDDTELALGSDLMSAALEGYAQLKVSGQGQGLDGLRQAMSTRFHRTPKPKKTS